MSAEILSALLVANIAASMAIVLVMLLRKPARKLMGARLAYYLWALPVLAGLATLLPPRDAGTLPSPMARLQPLAEATVDFATTWTAPAATAPARATLDFALVLLVVWAIGVAFFLAMMALQQWRTLRALDLPLGPKPDVNRAANGFGPAVVGVLQPRLVVPADFEERFSPREQDLVLAHERVHLAAGHTRLNAVAVVLASVNWFNPLAHWAARLSRVDQELACDAAVLELFPKQRGAYAEALLKTQIVTSALPLGCTWPSRSSALFMERMTMLANKSPSRARRLAGAGFLTVALLGAGFAAWAQKPPVPTFLAYINVEVDKDGNVKWNDDANAISGKDALLQRAKLQVASGVPRISVKVDAGTQYQNVGRVIEAAQRAGVEGIMFMPSGVVLETPKPPPPGSSIPAPPPVNPELAIFPPGFDPAQKSPKPPAAARPAGPPPPNGIPEPIRLFVDFEGSFYYDGVLVDAATMAAKFKEAAGQKIPPEVHIEPHRLSTYDKVEQVVVAANKAGLKKFGVLGGA
jgi:beta-lactamase regulating signal transducer with metallopeptidase domain/biopolymer transport protein ExbD